MSPGSHGSTYAGGPLAIAVGNAVMDIMLEDDFLDKVIEKGEYFKNRINKISEKFPGLIEGIRGRGLMIGLKLNEDKIPDSRALVNEIRKDGLLTVAAGENVVRMLPALNIEEDVIDEGLDILENYLEKHHG